ncbi:hypothetical protein BDV93DRAFT_457472, partial [Ceratobasidium sp. AG-I]
DLQTYLRGIGKYISTADVVRFTARPDIQDKWKLTKPISKATAQRWMARMSYRWRHEPRGLYFDGHERQDVVQYRQSVYLPRWNEMGPWMESFAAFEIHPHMDSIIRRVVALFHDETTFHANDRRTLEWVLMPANPKPVKKGEGASLMVSDIICAEYGWLCSPKR